MATSDKKVPSPNPVPGPRPNFVPGPGPTTGMSGPEIAGIALACVVGAFLVLWVGLHFGMPDDVGNPKKKPTTSRK